MCAVLNQPGLGQGPKLGKVGGHQVSTVLSPLCLQWQQNSGMQGCGDGQRDSWYVRVEYVPPRMCGVLTQNLRRRPYLEIGMVPM